MRICQIMSAVKSWQLSIGCHVPLPLPPPCHRYTRDEDPLSEWDLTNTVRRSRIKEREHEHEFTKGSVDSARVLSYRCICVWRMYALSLCNMRLVFVQYALCLCVIHASSLCNTRFVFAQCACNGLYMLIFVYTWIIHDLYIHELNTGLYIHGFVYTCM